MKSALNREHTHICNYSKSEYIHTSIQYIYICICICIRVYIYICIDIYIYVCVCLYIWTRIYKV